MRELVLKAAVAVEVGDEVENALCAGPASAWERVVAVERDGDAVVLRTRAWAARRHPAESVAVRRFTVASAPELE